MERILIKVDHDGFFYGNIDPEKFNDQLKKVIGDAILEDVIFCIGGENYDLLVTPKERGLRPRLMGIPGVVEVYSFNTQDKPPIG